MRSSSSTPPRSHVFRQPRVLGTGVTATVKWFDAERGFGFVMPAGGGADALLPGDLLAAFGHATLPEGATVVVDLIEARKGAQVSALHSVDPTTAAEPRPKRERAPAAAPAPRRAPVPAPAPAGETVAMTATVRWFNPDKGYGFAKADEGERDVFLHVSALERSNLIGLPDGQRVRLTVREGAKGLEAVTIETL